MDGEVEADVGLVGDVATIKDGPQLPSSSERAHSGVCGPTRSSPAVSQMAEKGRNDIEAQDEGRLTSPKRKMRSRKGSRRRWPPSTMVARLPVKKESSWGKTL